MAQTRIGLPKEAKNLRTKGHIRPFKEAKGLGTKGHIRLSKEVKSLSASRQKVAFAFREANSKEKLLK